MVAEEDIALKAHFTAALIDEMHLADCCAPRAAAFGINVEIHSTTAYDQTQAWASAFAQAGFAGVRYFCRSDPAARLLGYALFDQRGEAPNGAWPSGQDRPIDEAILREAEDYGLRARPSP
jgi:hypothetical protein